MEKQRSLPRAEDIYRHFKGGLYQILTLATHSESGEVLVIYRALYGHFKTYARPLSMFMEAVDRKKYPEVKEKYRFTRVEFVSSSKITPPEKKLSLNKPISEAKPMPEKEEKQIEFQENNASVSPPEDKSKAMSLFMEFLDENSFDKKRNLLRALSPIATSHIINSMAASLDLVPGGISKEADLKMISDYISARIHFDGSRLR